jgi:hypothetical protein
MEKKELMNMGTLIEVTAGDITEQSNEKVTYHKVGTADGFGYATTCKFTAPADMIIFMRAFIDDEIDRWNAEYLNDDIINYTSLKTLYHKGVSGIAYVQKLDEGDVINIGGYTAGNSATVDVTVIGYYLDYAVVGSEDYDFVGLRRDLKYFEQQLEAILRGS